MQMTDWPTTMPEFLARFGSDVLCRDYVARHRWPECFCCQQCGTRRCYWLTAKANV